jgi:hypothetical protein
MSIAEVLEISEELTKLLKAFNVSISHTYNRKEVFSQSVVRGYFSIILTRHSEVHSFDYFGPMPIQIEDVVNCLMNDAETDEDAIADMGYDFKEGLRFLRACQETRQKLIGILGSEVEYEAFKDEFQEQFSDL